MHDFLNTLALMRAGEAIEETQAELDALVTAVLDRAEESRRLVFAEQVVTPIGDGLGRPILFGRAA